MTPLATLEDLAAVGGVPVDVDADAPEGVRATRLIELTTAQVLMFLDGFSVDADAVEAWADERKAALAAIVAEIAAKRMNVSAGANVDPFVPSGVPQTLKLNRWEKQAIKDLLPPNADGDMPWMDP